MTSKTELHRPLIHSKCTPYNFKQQYFYMSNDHEMIKKELMLAIHCETQVQLQNPDYTFDQHYTYIFETMNRFHKQTDKTSKSTALQYEVDLKVINLHWLISHKAHKTHSIQLVMKCKTDSYNLTCAYFSSQINKQLHTYPIQTGCRC